MRPIYVAEVCGFCAGVRHALKLMNETLEHANGTPVYVLRGVIHNNFVTEQLKSRGVIFVEDTAEVPRGSCCIFGAHGVGQAVEQAAQERQLQIIDSTCPLVKKLHHAANRVAPENDLVIFGHLKHPEVAGVIGNSGTKKIHVIADVAEIDQLPPLHHPTLLCQTTLNFTAAEKVRCALQQRYPDLQGSGEICRASFERQHAVTQLAQLAPWVVVIGSAHSSNANRLRETAQASGAQAWLIESFHDLPERELATAPAVGVTAGASTPDELIEGVIARLEELGFSRAPWPAAANR